MLFDTTSLKMSIKKEGVFQPSSWTIYKYQCHFSQSDYVMLRHFLQKLSYNRNTADIVYRLNFSNSSQPVCSLSNHVKSIFFLLPVHILRSVLSQHPHISQMLHSLLHHHNISFSFVRPFLCLNCFGSQLSLSAFNKSYTYILFGFPNP